MGFIGEAKSKVIGWCFKDQRGPAAPDMSTAIDFGGVISNLASQEKEKIRLETCGWPAKKSMGFSGDNKPEDAGWFNKCSSGFGGELNSSCFAGEGTYSRDFNGVRKSSGIGRVCENSMELSGDS
ncbi:hypothetical protein MRX96_021265 [Rhipicephalus microplus]